MCDECREAEKAHEERLAIKQEPVVKQEAPKNESCSWGTNNSNNSYNNFSGYTYQTATPAVEQNGENPRMDGFGKALAGVIFIIPQIIFLYISIYMMVLGPVAIPFFMIGAGFAIASIVLGIKSIKFAIAQKKSGKPIPIPTLIMGIVALGESAPMLFCMLLLAFILFIAIFAFMMAY